MDTLAPAYGGFRCSRAHNSRSFLHLQNPMKLQHDGDNKVHRSGNIPGVHHAGVVAVRCGGGPDGNDAEAPC
eukprot:m.398802 g.398802  ORF g.398802 m.398802 type:complete len:72 (-) comp21141_c0_seq12:1666-1881(-)